MRETEQDKDDGRIFYDTDGNPRTLYQLVRQEPDWAVSRLEYYMGFHDDLIAAAPDLLEALEDILSVAEIHVMMSPDVPLDGPIGKARAAIAKARGK